jgi:hypothetical protein
MPAPGLLIIKLAPLRARTALSLTVLVSMPPTGVDAAAARYYRAVCPRRGIR